MCFQRGMKNQRLDARETGENITYKIGWIFLHRCMNIPMLDIVYILRGWWKKDDEPKVLMR